MENLTGTDLENYILYKLKNYNLKAIEEGERYYKGKHDIEYQKCLSLKEEDDCVFQNIIIKDNQYAKLVDQKVNYSFFHPPIVFCKESKDYSKALQDLFSVKYMRLWQKIAKDAMNMKMAWLYIYTDKKRFYIKRINPKTVIPIWSDATHTSLKGLIRKRVENTWDTEEAEIVMKRYVDYYTEKGLTTYLYEDDRLKFLSTNPYMIDGQGNGFNWDKIPFVYFKYSEEEITLLERVKSLQDTINIILSTFGNKMIENEQYSLYLSSCYDVNSSEMIKVNVENYQTYLKVLKERLVENGRGVIFKHSSNVTPIDVKEFFSDIVFDAYQIESEFQASFEYLQHFFKIVYNFDRDLLAILKFKHYVKKFDCWC